MAANEKQEYLTQDWQERDLYRRRFLAELDDNARNSYAWEARLLEAEKRCKEEIARKALAEGASVEFVQKITGLDMETIQKLSG